MGNVVDALPGPAISTSTSQDSAGDHRVAGASEAWRLLVESLEAAENASRGLIYAYRTEDEGSTWISPLDDWIARIPEIGCPERTFQVDHRAFGGSFWTGLSPTAPSLVGSSRTVRSAISDGLLDRMAFEQNCPGC